MGLPAAKRRYSIDEYLRIERDSRDKHEFHDGEILAMSGGTPVHSLVSSNVSRELGNRLKGKRCRVYESNLRIRIRQANRYVYADASVICGPLEFDPDDSKQESVTNPKVVVEVLSPSTERYDRTEKFDNYRQIPAFEEYVIVSQEQPRVEVFRRQPDGSWLFDVSTGTDSTAQIRSIGVELPLGEVYSGVEFPAPAPQAEADAAQPPQ